ncbi:MAG: hydroxymethylglutaryl-CoA lyase [Pseudomonadota bacterium]|jgi:hydroxymethylglutaryl-CoA lyase
MFSNHFPSQVRVCDVGARDGLQNEPQNVPTAVKIELVQRLQDAGLREIEVTSYVSPKWVPQMADNHAVMRGIVRRSGVRYAVLTPNLKGFEAALLDQPDEIVVFGAASEAFSQKNINCSVAESIDRFAPVVQAALQAGLRVRAAMSCCLGCPYEGAIAPARVGELAARLKGIGVQRVDLADTIGVGTPLQLQRALEATLAHFDLDHISGHFHDTYGQALSNTLAALQMGVWNFQSSVAGLGGCPYAVGATGNVATEDLVYLLHGLGLETGIDLPALVQTGAWISTQLGRPYGARAGRALLARC